MSDNDASRDEPDAGEPVYAGQAPDEKQTPLRTDNGGDGPAPVPAGSGDGDGALTAGDED
jgi:hypothetical protein